MIKNDAWITQMARSGMIEPFEPALVRRLSLQVNGLNGNGLNGSDRPVISYGLSSYGYDIRLSPAEFRIFRHIPGTVVDPKCFNPDNLIPTELHRDEQGEFFILPAHSYGLGVALEHLSVPDNISVICIGKSTYARCGIIANLTPAEAAWRGHLTLEFSNSSSADCRIYAGEGIVQLLFFEGEPCEVSYEKRRGKYQDQPQAVTIARI
ncbi:MAG: dCTP deaminase [Cyanobacteria bacterium P01_A01_bin.135]